MFRKDKISNDIKITNNVTYCLLRNDIYFSDSFVLWVYKPVYNKIHKDTLTKLSLIVN